MAVDDQSIIIVSIPQGTLPCQPFFKSQNWLFVTPVASGAAGRANIGLVVDIFVHSADNK